MPPAISASRSRLLLERAASQANRWGLANALAVVLEDVAAIEAGDEVTCLILSP